MSSPENRNLHLEQGWDISLDEMNPIFDEDGTVTLTSEHLSQALEIGARILVGSNEHPDRKAYGKVIETSPTTNTFKVKLED